MTSDLARRSLSRPPGMDIPRDRPRRTARYVIYGACALAAVVGATLGLRRLRAAAPDVDRASVWMDRVQRGPMLREVQDRKSVV